MKNLILTEDDIIQEGILIEEAKSDSRSFKPLYEKYYNPIFRFIYSKVEEKETAADLSSHVFLKALLNVKNYQHKKLPFSAWLYRIAQNEVMQYYRRTRKAREIHITEDLIKNLADDIDSLEPENLKVKLEKALESLTYQEVEMIQLRFYQNLSFKEIALIINVSENLSKVRTYRILDKIRKKLNTHQ